MPDAILDKIVASLEARVAPERRAEAARFVRRYFSRTPPSDIRDRGAGLLCTMALGHLDFAGQRSAGPIIRVFNPDEQSDDRYSTHTIVQCVAQDMPFLVDSISNELNRHGLTIHLTIHPVIPVLRDAGGHLQAVCPEARANDVVRESFLHFEVDRQAEGKRLLALREDLARILEDVSLAVGDWAAMRDKVTEIARRLAAHPPCAVAPEENAEACDFLRWIHDDNFALLGYREYDLVRQDHSDALRIVAGSGLGILRERDRAPISLSYAVLPLGARRHAREAHVLVITKSNSRATVHRSAYLDYVGIKRFDATGTVTGEHRFLGLYTSTAYNRDPRDIPLLRHKLAGIMRRSGLEEASHDGKVLLNILQTFPRDELFQASEEELFATTMQILHLQERQQVRLFVRRDPYERFFSCLVFVPRHNYTTALTQRIQDVLQEAMHGTSVEATAQLGESMLARIYYVVRTKSGAQIDFDLTALEQRVVEAARSWQDGLRQALLTEHREQRANALLADYARAFPAGYTDDFSSRDAVCDIEHLEAVRGGDTLRMRLYMAVDDPEKMLYFKVFQSTKPLSLSEALPVLENMGVQVVGERMYKVLVPGSRRIWIQEFGLLPQDREHFDLAAAADRFKETFARVWSGAVENDGFNRLVLVAGLDWRETVILRACSRYLIQTTTPFSHSYMEQALSANPAIARLLVHYFLIRFDPGFAEDRNGALGEIDGQIGRSLEQVESLDEERILRRFFDVLKATLRTNYFQRTSEGEPPAHFAFKLDPSALAFLPAPRPMFEIFVYSPRFEGAHLRGGRVARGGIRWSDRREDFRTEILGLMKAQMVKNSLIVPVGAKGGFVVKHALSPDPAQRLEQVRTCYSVFISALLDLTDNRVGDEILPPKDVVRHDEDDPYLVVAADRGTATFSDTANALACARGFWLDDAFASGGSTGYDHKRMGITARGAWESVKRHFRELGRDIQSEPFTVVGIGGMGGDVFGNGMLLSPYTRLVGAFNHEKIFIDPDPDPVASFAERRRLFDTPNSSWADYDRQHLSAGGDVYSRAAKQIRLSPEARRVLDTEQERLTPAELISILLRAPVDLLWSAGIGTFVKASSETHADVGDRANDYVRIDGAQLRCKVVGEGGNLGLTQLARVEYARQGGRVNPDFIDNSGGVSCSDKEVNIKILLNEVTTTGELNRKQRNELLAEMTDEVGRLVLSDNYQQAQGLAITAWAPQERLGLHARLIRKLERAGRLERTLEFLPGEEDIGERQTRGEGLSRPELAVLFAYSKIALYDELLDSDVPEDPYFETTLAEYFPSPLRQRYRATMPSHRLGREIVATVLTDRMMNSLGITFLQRVSEHTDKTAAEVARCYAAARDIFGTAGLRRSIEALDNQVPDSVQMLMHREVARLLKRASLWLLRQRRQPIDIAATVTAFSPGAAEIGVRLPELVVVPHRKILRCAARRWIKDGVPAVLAHRIAQLGACFSALDITQVARGGRFGVSDTARVYFILGLRLKLFWLREIVAKLPPKHRWQESNQAALFDELYDHQRELTAQVIAGAGRRRNPQALVERWLARFPRQLDRLSRVLSDLGAAETDLAMLSVATRAVAELATPVGGATDAAIRAARALDRSVS